MMEPARSRRLVHLELHTGDLPGARSFYAGLCGWRSEQIASYEALDLGGGEVGGGIVSCPSPCAVFARR